MHRRWVLALPLLALSCSRGPETPVVGVVPKGSSHHFWQTVHAGANKAAQEYGLRVEWNAPTMETGTSRQIEIIESMVNRKLAGIALAPVDKEALVRIVDRAHDEGIPVAIFDSGIDTQKRVTYVATDNREGGRMAARQLAKEIGEKGKVAYISFMPGSASTMEREAGFREELAKHPDVHLVGMQFAQSDRAKARAQTENFLTAHPDLAGIFADNESSAAGAVMGLKARSAHQVAMVAFDASEQLLAELQGGWIDALVVQNPFVMGYESVKALALALKKEQPQPLINSGATLVTRDNLQEPKVHALLHPPVEQYLR